MKLGDNGRMGRKGGFRESCDPSRVALEPESPRKHPSAKPMIEIGGKPILWHILKIHSHHHINDFVICCGYRGTWSRSTSRTIPLYVRDEQGRCMRCETERAGRQLHLGLLSCSLGQGVTAFNRQGY